MIEHANPEFNAKAENVQSGSVMDYSNELYAITNDDELEEFLIVEDVQRLLDKGALLTPQDTDF